MALQIDLKLVALILIVSVVAIVRYLLIRSTRPQTREKLWKLHHTALEEQENFLKIFNSTPFYDFSLLDFDLACFNFSYVSPFPELVNGEWRYGIYLTRSEAEDISTITHEISECTLGRVIERLLNLEKPLFLQRKELDKFWIHGKKQKYLVEHVLATFGEIDDLTRRKLKERLDEEDIKSGLTKSMHAG